MRKSRCNVMAPVACVLVALFNWKYTSGDSAEAVSAESAALVALKRTVEAVLFVVLENMLEKPVVDMQLMPEAFSEIVPVGEVIVKLPVPLLVTVSASFVPLDNTDTATPPPAAAPFIDIPVATEAVLASIWRTGFVLPLAPAVNAVAEAAVIVSVLEVVKLVKAPVLAVPLPIAPGAANVAPLSEEALRLATLVVEVTTNGAVPIATVDVN